MNQFIDQYLRAIAKRALPIFQSNNFTYLGVMYKKNYGKIPTEDEIYYVLKMLYRKLLRKCEEVSLGRFHMFFSSSPVGIKVFLDISDHEWNWYPEKVFKEEQDPQEQIMDIELTRQKEIKATIDYK